MTGLSRLTSLVVVVAVFFSAYGVYRATDRHLTIVDVSGVMWIPLSLWSEGNLNLDEYRERIPGRALRERDGHLVSWFPATSAFQMLPVYLADGIVQDPNPSDEYVWMAQRRAAQVSVALTTALLALSVARCWGLTTGVVTAIMFGLGSINWFVLSQVSFSNGLVELWVALALLISSNPPTTRSGWREGASLSCLAFASFIRPNLGVTSLAWLDSSIRRGRPLRAAAVTLLLPALVCLAMGFLYFSTTGHVLGFYGAQLTKPRPLVSPQLGTALIGNLLSPARGLLVFSPWILLAVAAPWVVTADRRRATALQLASCIAHLVLTSNHWDWYGGGSMGPRLTADILPLWAFLAAPVIRRLWTLKVIGRGLVAALTCWSVVIAATHSTYAGPRWNTRPVNLRLAEERIFDWRDALVLDPLRRSEYEGRYPIHLLSPPITPVSGDTIRFSWEPVAERSKEHVQLRFFASRRHRVLEKRIEGTAGSAALGAEELGGEADSTRPFAWRVVSVSNTGAITHSGWRRLLWSVPDHDRVDDHL